MGAFLELKEKHVKYILDYIEDHGFAAHGFYYGLKKNGDTWSLRNGTTFFGYVKEKALIGMVQENIAPADLLEYAVPIPGVDLAKPRVGYRSVGDVAQLRLPLDFEPEQIGDTQELLVVIEILPLRVQLVRQPVA